MARQKPEDLDKEFKKQDSEVYEPELTGEDDSVDILEDAIGNEPDDTKPFTIAGEVEADELDRHSMPSPSPSTSAEEEEEAEEEDLEDL